MALVKADLVNKNASEKVQISKLVESSMQANHHFVDPIPALAAITAKREALEGAIADAANGDRVALALRNTLDRELSQLLVAACGYVNCASNGDRDVALTSGFVAAKIPSPIPLVDPPYNVTAKPTTKRGEVMVRFKTHHGSRTKQIYMTTVDPATNPQWTQAAVTTKTQCLITGLDPDKFYWFRLNAVCTAGISGFSEPAKCRPAA
ncbi:MAG: fibronectin type III domain-containing protein [Flavobacteriales bacterium]